MSGRIAPSPPPYSSVRRPSPPPYAVADQSSSSVDSSSSSLPRTPAPVRPVYRPELVRFPVRTQPSPVTSSGPPFCAECVCVAICVLSFAVISPALGIAASVRFGDPCFSKSRMHCDIPECQCGTPQQKPECQNYQGPWQEDTCTASKLRKHEKGGGNAYTWQLAIAACVALWAAIVILCSSFARSICVVDQSRRENWDGGRRAEPKEMACGGFISLGVYMTVAALIGIVLFIGVILARKEVHDFVNLVTMVQWLVYLGIAFVVFTSLLLIGAYRLD